MRFTISGKPANTTGFELDRPPDLPGGCAVWALVLLLVESASNVCPGFGISSCAAAPGNRSLARNIPGTGNPFARVPCLQSDLSPKPSARLMVPTLGSPSLSEGSIHNLPRHHHHHRPTIHEAFCSCWSGGMECSLSRSKPCSFQSREAVTTTAAMQMLPWICEHPDRRGGLRWQAEAAPKREQLHRSWPSRLGA